MLNYLKAELLKQKHSSNHIMIWLIPMINIIITLLLMGTYYIQTASYNWWYILFLPFVLTYVSAIIIKNDKKYNFHGLFGIMNHKKNLWYAKIETATIYFFYTCFIFLILNLVCGFIFDIQIPVYNNCLASVVLFITFAWQIPLVMFIALRLNMFIALIISIVCNLFISCISAVESYWWIPFSIPARLMCPIIKVLPNGLLMAAEHPLNQTNVIFPGIVITIALYLIISFITANFFENQEV